MKTKPPWVTLVIIETYCRITFSPIAQTELLDALLDYPNFHPFDVGT